VGVDSIAVDHCFVPSPYFNEAKFLAIARCSRGFGRFYGVAPPLAAPRNSGIGHKRTTGLVDLAASN
jgi:hypothetical protein